MTLYLYSRSVCLYIKAEHSGFVTTVTLFVCEWLMITVHLAFVAVGNFPELPRDTAQRYFMGNKRKTRPGNSYWQHLKQYKLKQYKLNCCFPNKSVTHT